MSVHMDERYSRMTAEQFRARYTFPLTPQQHAVLERAEGLGLELEVLIGYACGRRYLLELDVVEEERQP